jgi:hypothetical protein
LEQAWVLLKWVGWFDAEAQRRRGERDWQALMGRLLKGGEREKFDTLGTWRF